MDTQDTQETKDRKERAAAARGHGGRTPRPGVTLALLATVQFVVALDYNIVYVALPDIGAALGFTDGSSQWIVSAYAVAFGGLLLFGGRVVDRLGARRVLVAGLAVFGLACLAGGLAGSPGALIAARAAQGLGAALLAPATLTLINTRFTEGPQRTRALAVWGAFGSAGLAAGALLGGVLTQAWGWEWVLFVLVPFALLAAVAAPFALTPDGPGPAGRGGFDAAGAALATAGSSLLVLGLVSAPESGWFTARGLGCTAAGLVLLGVFALLESRTRAPLVPVRLLRNRDLVVSMLVILVFQSALGGAYYLFTTYVQGVLGWSALEAGLSFLPLTVVSMGASLLLAGRLLARRGARTTLVVGLLVNGVGLGALAVAMVAGASFWALLPGLLVWGVGGGVTFPAMFVGVTSGVAPGEAGAASALATTAQQIGGAAGLAGLVAVATAGADVAGGLRTAMAVAGAASVAAVLLAFVIRRAPATGRD
ncbi:MFS transporter [Streptomyces avicenniae]|uniref:MFS transporter n=1 Tax=Streptomyces avicenniae TaxID=500153 RepID=UPI000DA5EF38|nr:MFS transporter [Streptomyces avicenniae]